MSNKKSVESVESGESKSSFGRIFPIGIIALLAVGVFGAVGSNLNLFGGSSANPMSQNSANPSIATQNATTSQPINPTNAPPPTSATPQLSKEYVYAGSRMLAVEDANANTAPPADLAVWRPSSGVWYVLGGPNSAQTFFQWERTATKPHKVIMTATARRILQYFAPQAINGGLLIQAIIQVTRLHSAHRAIKLLKPITMATAKPTLRFSDLRAELGIFCRVRAVRITEFNSDFRPTFRVRRTTTATAKRMSACGEIQTRHSIQTTAETACYRRQQCRVRRLRFQPTTMATAEQITRSEAGIIG
jgi:hypothetical protein